MAVTGRFYPQFFNHLVEKRIDWTSDTIKGALVNGYTFSAAHDYFNDAEPSEVTGTGYTEDGQSLGTCTITVTAADSWSVAHATSTAYALGAVVRPSTGNGYLYQCITAGTSHSSAPTWPTTVGDTVTETGGVKWCNVGTAIVVLDDDGTNLSWTSSTIAAATGLVVYADLGGATSADPLIAYLDFGTTESSANGTFDVTFSSVGIAAIFV